MVTAGLFRKPAEQFVVTRAEYPIIDAVTGEIFRQHRQSRAAIGGARQGIGGQAQIGIGVGAAVA